MKTCIFTICTFFLALTGIAQPQNGYMKYSMSVEGEGAEMMSAMMPNSMELFYGHDKSLIRISGGMASAFFGDILSDNAQPDTAYMIMHSSKTVYLLPNDKKEDQAETAKPEMNVVTEKTGRSETINGYKSEEYKIITTTSENKTQEAYLWTTRDIKVPKPRAAANGSQFGAMFGYKVDGFPVRYQIPVKDQGLNLTTTITLMEYNQKAQPKSRFEIPASYKRELFRAEKLMSR